MKKCIAFLLAIWMFTVCFCFSVSAENMAEFVVSEDLLTVTYLGDSYSRMDISDLVFEEWDLISAEVRIEGAAADQIKFTRVYTATLPIAIEICFYYKDGSTLDVYYVADSYREQLHGYLTEPVSTVSLALYWTDEFHDFCTLEELKGSPVTVTAEVLSQCDYFDVYFTPDDIEVEVLCGSLLVYQNRAYFVDFQETANRHPAHYFSPEDYQELHCYEITDPQIQKEIVDCVNDYYGYGLLQGDLATVISLVFWCILFLLLPFAMMISGIIFFNKGKGLYRPVWGIAAALSGITVASFIAIIVHILSA